MNGCIQLETSNRRQSAREIIYLLHIAQRIKVQKYPKREYFYDDKFVCVCVSALMWRHAGQLATLGVNDDNTQLPIITNRAQVNSKHCLYSVIKWSSPRISKKKSDLAFWLCVCDDKTTRDNSNETWIITCKANQYACRNWKYQRADNVAKDSFGTTDVKIMAHRQFLHTDKSLPF